MLTLYTIRCSQKYSFALTGKTWSLLKQYCPELIPKIITRASVFSRMSPDQKQQLVQELQGIGYYVGKYITKNMKLITYKFYLNYILHYSHVW